MIFVFGSNLKGFHGAGAALHAVRKHGAVVGQGTGLQGQSYAIPTCSVPGKALALGEIKKHVEVFLAFAAASKTLQFHVTRIGCGFAGYTDEDIAPMFKDAPENVWIPGTFGGALYEAGLQSEVV